MDEDDIQAHMEAVRNKMLNVDDEMERSKERMQAMEFKSFSPGVPCVNTISTMVNLNCVNLSLKSIVKRHKDPDVQKLIKELGQQYAQDQQEQRMKQKQHDEDEEEDADLLAALEAEGGEEDKEDKKMEKLRRPRQQSRRMKSNRKRKGGQDDEKDKGFDVEFVLQSKKQFDHCISIKYPGHRTNIAIKLFINGRLHITGPTSMKETYRAASFAIDIIHMTLLDKTKEEYTSKPCICIGMYNIQMYNTNFSCHATLDREAIHEILKQKGLYAQLDDRLAAIRLKLMTDWRIPSPMEQLRGKVSKMIAIMIFRTGQIIITGAKDGNELETSYNTITKILDDNWDAVCIKTHTSDEEAGKLIDDDVWDACKAMLDDDDEETTSTTKQKTSKKRVSHVKEGTEKTKGMATKKTKHS